MSSELQQVIRLVMCLYRHSQDGLSKRTKIGSRGALLVLLSSQPSSPTPRQLIYTVAAAGQWFGRKVCRITELEERISSFVSPCDCPYEEELNTFSHNFGVLRFVYSFQIDQDFQDMETETERFLQRVSLVRSQITIVFKVKNKEYTHQQVFSFKSRRPKPVMDHFIARDSTSYAHLFSVESLSSCCQMHLVLGEQLPLLLPPEAVEAGLCGQMSVASVASLGPCMDQYPNWPARLSYIRVLVYSPSGIPIMRGEGQTQLSFLQSLADSLVWGKLGLAGVHCADTHASQGPRFYEMEFSTEDEHCSETEPVCSQAVYMKSDVHTVEQTVTIILLMEYRDPFHSQLIDLVASEEILEKQLERVLWHNVEKVRAALQSLLENTLRVFLKRKKSRAKVQSAISVIVSSVNSIVSSSSNGEFRSACLNSMKVQNTSDLTKSLHQTLHRVIGGRFVSSLKCTTGKATKASVSKQNGSASLEQSLPGKRTQKETEEPPVSSPKRWCSETTDGDCDFSESSWEGVDLQLTPQSSSQHPEFDLSRLSPNSQINVKLKNQQVEREWLQELENLSEWD